jgi:hypothetical protein
MTYSINHLSSRKPYSINSVFGQTNFTLPLYASTPPSIDRLQLTLLRTSLVLKFEILSGHKLASPQNARHVTTINGTISMHPRLITLGALAASVVSSAVAAQTAPDSSAPTPTESSAPPAAPASWASTITNSIHIEGGATFNPAGPDDGLNFGHLFTDKSNDGLLNQVAITSTRPLDPKATGVDIGYKLQGFYGSDARYTHFIGELDRDQDRRNQFDVVEANVLIHVPILTKLGIDIKAGQYSTPIGNEVIDPTGNFFYSHTYIFNFGIPLKHTGFYTTTHVSPVLDIYAGYDTGVNTSVGSKGGDNAGEFHFLGGFGLNMGKLTVLALTHIGPENPDGSLGPHVNVHSYNRYENDAVITYKFNDKLTSITELNYIRDDGVGATGGGVAQYFTYVLTPEVTAGVRGEVWRDNNGFYVAAFPGNLDYIDAATGRLNGSFGGYVTTYGAITLGVNFKPAKLPKMIDGLVFRPEVRYDRALAGANPFDSGHSVDQFTFGIDAILPINF